MHIPFFKIHAAFIIIERAKINPQILFNHFNWRKKATEVVAFRGLLCHWPDEQTSLFFTAKAAGNKITAEKEIETLLEEYYKEKEEIETQ